MCVCARVCADVLGLLGSSCALPKRMFAFSAYIGAAATVAATTRPRRKFGNATRQARSENIKTSSIYHDRSYVVQDLLFVGRFSRPKDKQRALHLMSQRALASGQKARISRRIPVWRCWQMSRNSPAAAAYMLKKPHFMPMPS